MANAARNASVPASELRRWQERFLEGGRQALHPTSSLDRARLAHIGQLERKLGQMALENDRLRKQLVARGRDLPPLPDPDLLGEE